MSKMLLGEAEFPETERIYFRKFTLDDLPMLIKQRSDPEVNRYLGGTRLQNPEALARRIRFYISCYASHGYGNCAMIWKKSGEMIGSAGLQPLEETDEIEIGYSIIKEFWRMGIGFEAAAAWLRFGFEKAGLERIVAVCDPENTGSRRIMEKCGMTFEKAEDHYGLAVVCYAVTRADWLATGLGAEQRAA
ncbi:MAG TPA: N-acetyltransferase [Blastocatellia bacterium]|nr:N-acetyltransferase [Blastocatellia bacterium]